MEQFARDLSHALRGLRRSPGFALTAIVTIALGVGVNTTIFSVIDSTLFKPLPYDRPEDLVTLAHRVRPGTAMESFYVGISWAEIDAWRAESGIFEGVEGAAGARTREWHEANQELICGSFTAGLPALLGVAPKLGRVFTPAEARDEAPVIVIAEPLWTSAFSRRPDVVGSAMTIDNRVYTIVGVMPGWFRYGPGGSGVVLAWTALAEHGEQRPSGQNTIFRIRRGLTLEAAEARALVAAQRMQEANPPKEAWTPRLHSMVQGLREGNATLVSPMWLLFLAAGGVLLVACASVGNLLWMRSDSRGRELAMRRVLGASRARLFRLLVCEGLVVGVLGGVAAVLLAHWCLAAMIRLIPTYLQRSMFALSPAALDARALLFAATATLVVATLSAAWPAIAGARTAPGGTQIVGRTRTRRRTSQVLQAAQVALAFVLATTAGLFATSFAAVLSKDLGFDPRGLGSVSVGLPESRYPTPAAQRLARDEALARVRAVPGVRRAGIGPSPIVTMGAGMVLPGASTAAGSLAIRPVGDGYFETAGIRLIAGRDFGPGDTPASPHVAIIDEAGARRVFGNESPLGRRFKYSPYAPEMTIVGVASAVVAADFVTSPGRIGMYFAESQDDPAMAFLIRADGDLSSVLKNVQLALEAFDSGITPGAAAATFFFEPYETYLVPRFYLVLVATFAVLALVTASVGVYGLVAYSMGQRRRELGIRLALGSSLGRIRALVVTEAGGPVVAGLAIGLMAAWWTVGLTQSLLFGIGARDPRGFALGLIALLAATSLAVVAPMRRASRVDPVAALRAD